MARSLTTAVQEASMVTRGTAGLPSVTPGFQAPLSLSSLVRPLSVYSRGRDGRSWLDRRDPGWLVTFTRIIAAANSPAFRTQTGFRLVAVDGGKVNPMKPRASFLPRRRRSSAPVGWVQRRGFALTGGLPALWLSLTRPGELELFLLGTVIASSREKARDAAFGNQSSVAAPRLEGTLSIGCRRQAAVPSAWRRPRAPGAWFGG